MGNCFGLIRDITSYPPETYERILNTFSWRFEQIKYSPRNIKVDKLYDWNRLPFIRLNEEFIHKCVQKYNINKYNYNIIESGGEFKIKFHKTIRQSVNINSVVPYNEMCHGDLGFSYI
jgi:hypothetical protein